MFDFDVTTLTKRINYLLMHSGTLHEHAEFATFEEFNVEPQIYENGFLPPSLLLRI